jgi:hypothetical protein
MSVQTLIQVRRGTADQWYAVNPTLSAGEWGLETDTGRYKIGDGLTAWRSLDYSSLLPNSNDLIGASGVGINFGVSGVPVTVSITGIVSSQVTDFNSAVSGIVAGMSISTEEVMDIVGTGLTGASGVGIDYQDASNQIVVNITGIETSQINNFNSSISGLIPVKDITASTGIGVSNTDGNYSVSVTGISSSLVTDFTSAVENIVDTSLSAGSGISLVYNSGTDTLTISATGFSLIGHQHTLADVTDVTASAIEVNYLDGSTPGTGVAGKAVVLDSNNSIVNIGSITTTGDIVVGGNLTVSGSSTIVNSTVVEIGDNIVRLNTASGVATGGIEVKTPDNDYESFVWNNTNNRWEFSGTGVYVNGKFIGNLQGTADTVITNANLTGDVTSVGNATSIASGVIVNEDINASAGIAYTKLNLTGSIVNADIASGAAIAVSKLASGTTGQILQVSSTGVVWGSIDGGTP